MSSDRFMPPGFNWEEAKARRDASTYVYFVEAIVYLTQQTHNHGLPCQGTGDGPGYAIASIERPGPSRLRARHGQGRDRGYA